MGKITNLTSKELLIELFGVHSIHAYEAVKAGSMQIGHLLANALIVAVGGTIGTHRDSYDGVTRYGQWEFCLQRNTKNYAGNSSDLTRHPGRCVQILETPNPGWMSAEDFLVLHGREPEVLLECIEDIRARFSANRQMRLGV